MIINDEQKYGVKVSYKKHYDELLRESLWIPVGIDFQGNKIITTHAKEFLNINDYDELVISDYTGFERKPGAKEDTLFAKSTLKSYMENFIRENHERYMAIIVNNNYDLIDDKIRELSKNKETIETLSDDIENPENELDKIKLALLHTILNPNFNSDIHYNSIDSSDFYIHIDPSIRPHIFWDAVQYSHNNIVKPKSSMDSIFNSHKIIDLNEFIKKGDSGIIKHFESIKLKEEDTVLIIYSLLYIKILNSSRTLSLLAKLSDLKNNRYWTELLDYNTFYCTDDNTVILKNSNEEKIEYSNKIYKKIQINPNVIPYRTIPLFDKNGINLNNVNTLLNNKNIIVYSFYYEDEEFYYDVSKNSDNNRIVFLDSNNNKKDINIHITY